MTTKTALSEGLSARKGGGSKRTVAAAMVTTSATVSKFRVHQVRKYTGTSLAGLKITQYSGHPCSGLSHSMYSFCCLRL